MTPQEIIDVVTAYKNGAEIQFQAKENPYTWLTASKPTWNFRNLNYRVKPIPRRWYCVKLGDNSIRGWETLGEMQNNSAHLNVMQRFTVMEEL